MNKKLNVIFLGSFLYPKGYAATKRKQQFIDYIVGQGHSVKVYITLKWANGHQVNNSKGVYKSVPFEVLGKGVKKNLLFPFFFIKYLFVSSENLWRSKNKENKNVIVAFGINYDTIIPLLFAKIIGYKVVFDIVEDIVLAYNNTLKNRLKKILISSLSFIFMRAINSGISVITTILKKKYALVTRKQEIRLIPISASNLQHSSIKVEKTEVFKVLYSGTYGKKEGLNTLFEAFHMFSATHKNIVLVLTGDCPQEIKSYLGELFHDKNKIEFTERLEDNEYYQALKNADVLMMTRTNSDYANAGFPYKLGEYLATGNPVIATKVSDIQLYLEDRVSAYLVDPDSVSQVLIALEEIYNNRVEGYKVGEKGKNVCEAFFNPAINSRMFYEMLLKC